MHSAIKRSFTLIELLVVVAIIAILAAIATVNLRLATERARKSADAANLKVLCIALQTYLVDYGTLPPADREAGPFASHTTDFVAVGNGPAAGGSWDGVPWLLHDLGYVTSTDVFFNPKYRRLYDGGTTIRGGWPRFHNFRYAYNAAALSSGGAGAVLTGEVWILRNLWLGPRGGFYAASFPNYPADYSYPWGEGDQEDRLEHAVYADMAVRTVVGGTDEIVR